jgi:small subunit ribosomal protein S11
MGKKRIIKKGESAAAETAATVALKKKIKRSISHGFAYVNSTYNNTIITFTDEAGSVLFWGSAGSLGFSGAKKGTPYAASKVASLLAGRASAIGLSEIAVFVRGIGAGRESAIRSLSAGGLAITTIKDITPVPFNGPKPPKVRRV